MALCANAVYVAYGLMNAFYYWMHHSRKYSYISYLQIEK